MPEQMITVNFSEGGQIFTLIFALRVRTVMVVSIPTEIALPGLRVLVIARYLLSKGKQIHLRTVEAMEIPTASRAAHTRTWLVAAEAIEGAVAFEVLEHSADIDPILLLFLVEAESV